MQLLKAWEELFTDGDLFPGAKWRKLVASRFHFSGGLWVIWGFG